MFYAGTVTMASATVASAYSTISWTLVPVTMLAEF